MNEKVIESLAEGNSIAYADNGFTKFGRIISVRDQSVVVSVLDVDTNNPSVSELTTSHLFGLVNLRWLQFIRVEFRYGRHLAPQ